MGVKLMEPDIQVCQQLCDEADGCYEIEKSRHEKVFGIRNA
jgi:hypothetical protein